MNQNFTDGDLKGVRAFQHSQPVSPEPCLDRTDGTPSAAAHPDWFVIRVRPNREKAVRLALQQAAIEEYFPYTSERSVWSDRTKQIDRPLFPGYLFARFSLSRQSFIRQIEHVYEILGTAHNPIAVTPAEMAEVRRVLATLTMRTAPAERPTFALDSSVVVTRGAFAGQHGIVQRLKGNARLAVTLEILRRSVNVEFDSEDLEAA